MAKTVQIEKAQYGDMSYPLDPIMKDLRDCKSHISFKGYFNRDRKGIMPFAHIILGGVLRDFFIYKVKLPIQTVIEAGKSFTQVMQGILPKVRLIPEITRKNTKHQNTHNIMAIEKKFFEYDTLFGRRELYKAAFKILKMEIEHDGEKRFKFDWFTEELIKLILAGKWKVRPEGEPGIYWNEPAPFGGEHSIIYKLQKHREEILKLIGKG